MSQGFRTKFDQMRESSPASQATDKFGPLNYEEPNGRNLCFSWTDGKKIFLNYSYLIFGEYLPDVGAIKVIFTSHEISLEGANLEPLFYDLMQQLVRQIECVDTRYNSVADDGNPIVNVMTIKKHEV